MAVTSPSGKQGMSPCVANSATFGKIFLIPGYTESVGECTLVQGENSEWHLFVAIYASFHKTFNQMLVVLEQRSTSSAVVYFLYSTNFKHMILIWNFFI